MRLCFLRYSEIQNLLTICVMVLGFAQRNDPNRNVLIQSVYNGRNKRLG